MEIKCVAASLSVKAAADPGQRGEFLFVKCNILQFWCVLYAVLRLNILGVYSDLASYHSELLAILASNEKLIPTPALSEVWPTLQMYLNVKSCKLQRAERCWTASSAGNVFLAVSQDVRSASFQVPVGEGFCS
jgi:hypothetical protein